MKKGENVNGKGDQPVANFFCFSERTSTFSLESWNIRPSTVFATRRKTVLCGAAYTWVPDL